MSSGSSFASGDVWSFILLIAVVLLSLIIANTIKQYIKILNQSLIPVSVIAGGLLLIVSAIFKYTTGDYLFNQEIFCAGSSVDGITKLEILTYHCLGLGFVAMTLRKSKNKALSKERIRDVINTGTLTVSTYLIQAIAGLAITFVAAKLIPNLIEASGIILCFGYGQGTGQALNYGSIYEQYGLVGGKSFGLSIAALGFLSAAIGGVIYLNIHKKKGDITIRQKNKELNNEMVEGSNEVPMVDSIDKITLQIAIVIFAYACGYAVMFGLSKVLPESLVSTIFGFNFLFGTLMAVVFKAIIGLLQKSKIMHRDYLNDFLLNRLSGFAFDVMIVAGIGAIQIDLIKEYIGILLILGAVGALITFLYDKFVIKRLFGDYVHEQFMVMYGMLTGTASTGVILLREIDPEYETPASENIVYQNFPAIVMGFPLMILASYAPTTDKSPYVTFAVMVASFIVLNLFLFRSKIFKRKNKQK